ncbi:unnamed protein product [Candidula unifasciata]|uniref:Delta-like protein n=1 Tax=Candidula unifasciata TaxID=100452 RepID=A0A8S3YFD7_9EUPU|nr:unnamed protein product [Candidula unifasciata]
MQTWGTMMAETVYSSKNDAIWATAFFFSMIVDFYRLVFQIRIYCETNYYNSNCTKYCLASNGPKEHYTCDPETGAKICLPGWTGLDCTEDIDECLLNYCGKGICVNLQADYLCYCPNHDTGILDNSVLKMIYSNLYTVLAYNILNATYFL